MKARMAWKRLYCAGRNSIWQQQLQLAQQEAAVQLLQAAVRGWLARRAAARQVAGITRFQVGGHPMLMGAIFI